MQTIITQLTEVLEQENQVCFQVLNPDMKKAYAGQIIELDNQSYIYRSLKAWMDLSMLLHTQMKMPKIVDENFIELCFEKLNDKQSFHRDEDSKEKYGSESDFALINKNEEPSFIYYYEQALKNADIKRRFRVLNLGVNSGDEFAAIKKLLGNLEHHELVGVDYSQSAIDQAKESFKTEPNMKFVCADINTLDAHALGEFDLIISIGTLQSSNLDFNKVFMNIVQNHLKKEGAMILGFPNCRWIDTQMIYGAMMKNYPYSELSNLFKDVQFCKKYLQQKKYRVTITGKEYIFLTATSIRK